MPLPHSCLPNSPESHPTAPVIIGSVPATLSQCGDTYGNRTYGFRSRQAQRLAQSVACARTARFWVEEAARRLSLDEAESSNIVAFANLTRMITERCALDVMEIVQRGVGLSSFIQPHPIERISRDLATYLRQPVPDLAMSDGAKSFLNSTLSVADF